MIDALVNAQNVASQEISIIENSQGDIYLMPWSRFPDNDLYRKLAQYRQGLIIYAVNKYGEETVKRILEGHNQSIPGGMPYEI